MNPTRIGKIARLSRPVREQLNRRLDNGEPGTLLVPWLNALPEVQAVLAAQFEGRPINEQNLSAWKLGGFVDWQRHEEAREWVGEVIAETGGLEAAPGGVGLADRMTPPVVVALVDLLQKGQESDTTGERRKAVLGAAQHLSRLRRGAHQTEHLRLEYQRWEEKEGREAPPDPPIQPSVT